MCFLIERTSQISRGKKVTENIVLKILFFFLELDFVRENYSLLSSCRAALPEEIQWKVVTNWIPATLNSGVSLAIIISVLRKPGYCSIYSCSRSHYSPIADLNRTQHHLQNLSSVWKSSFFAEFNERIFSWTGVFKILF